MIEKVNLPDLCLRNIVFKPEDLKLSSTADTLSQESGTPKTNSKGEGDKERGKPAASSKTSSRQETVKHHCSSMTNKNKAALCIYFSVVA